MGRLCGGISPASPSKSPQQRGPTHPGAPSPHPGAPPPTPALWLQSWRPAVRPQVRLGVSKGRGKGCVGAGRQCPDVGSPAAPGPEATAYPPAPEPCHQGTCSSPGGVPPVAAFHGRKGSDQRALHTHPGAGSPWVQTLTLSRAPHPVTQRNPGIQTLPWGSCTGRARWTPEPCSHPGLTGSQEPTVWPGQEPCTAAA